MGKSWTEHGSDGQIAACNVCRQWTLWGISWLLISFVLCDTACWSHAITGLMFSVIWIMFAEQLINMMWVVDLDGWYNLMIWDNVIFTIGSYSWPGMVGMEPCVDPWLNEVPCNLCWSLEATMDHLVRPLWVLDDVSHRTLTVWIVANNVTGLFGSKSNIYRHP